MGHHRILSGDKAGIVRAWDTASGLCLGEVATPGGEAVTQLVILVGYASHDAIEAAASSERFHKDQGSYTTPNGILKCGEELVHAVFSKYGLIATARNPRVRNSVVLLFEGNDFKEMFHLRGILQSFYSNHRGAFEAWSNTHKIILKKG